MAGRKFYFFESQAEVDEWKLKYYSDPRVFFLIVPYLAGRETALISGSGAFTTARHMKVHSVPYLVSNFNAFDFTNRDYMIYYSIAGYFNHPTFSYAPADRHRQQREWVDGVKDESGVVVEPPQMIKYVVSYDLFFDFDCHGKIYKDPKRSEAYRDCRALRDFLRRFGVKYRITFSGSGFHLIVPYEQFSSVAGDVKNLDFMQEGNPYNFCMRIRERLVSRLGLGSVDLTVIDASRVCKAPWSYTRYATIALPMETDEQFDHFDIKSCDPRVVLSRQDLFMKGLQFTNTGSHTGFLKLLKVLEKW